MTYRMLPAEEWLKLIPLAGENAHLIPSPEVASVAVAEDEDGVIQGAIFLQLVLHMEPIVLKTPYANYHKLMDLLHQSIEANKGLVYYAFSGPDVVNKMFERVGFEKLEYGVYRREVT